MSTPRTQAARTKAALALSKKLLAAADAMARFRMACSDDGDIIYADDQRTTLGATMREYGGYLESVHDKRPQS